MPLPARTNPWIVHERRRVFRPLSAVRVATLGVTVAIRVDVVRIGQVFDNSSGRSPPICARNVGRLSG